MCVCLCLVQYHWPDASMQGLSVEPDDDNLFVWRCSIKASVRLPSFYPHMCLINA